MHMFVNLPLPDQLTHLTLRALLFPYFMRVHQGQRGPGTQKLISFRRLFSPGCGDCFLLESVPWEHSTGCESQASSVLINQRRWKQTFFHVAIGLPLLWKVCVIQITIILILSPNVIVEEEATAGTRFEACTPWKPVACFSIWSRPTVCKPHSGLLILW